MDWLRRGQQSGRRNQEHNVTPKWTWEILRKVAFMLSRCFTVKERKSLQTRIHCQVNIGHFFSIFSTNFGVKGAVLVLILGCNEQVNTCLMTFCVLNLPTQSCYMKNLINVRHLTIKDELVSTVNTDLYIVRHKVRFCPHKSFGTSWL